MAPLILLKMVIIPLLMVGSFVFYRCFPNRPQDTACEERVEIIINDLTGLDIDLSPETPEE